MDGRRMRLHWFRVPDGSYMALDGNTYSDAESFLMISIMGFCGCGRPSVLLKYVADGLRLIDDLMSGPDMYHDKPGWVAFYREHVERCRLLFGTEQAEYLFYYWADKEGLTEHGGSVPGWLDTKGANTLSLLEDWLGTPEKDAA